MALSRARLGLYVVGRREVFESSLELREAFGMLFKRGEGKWGVVVGEVFPTRRGVEEVVEEVLMEGVEHLGKYVYEMTQAKVKALKEGEGVLPPLAITDGRDGQEDDGDAEEEMDEEAADEMEGDGVA